MWTINKKTLLLAILVYIYVPTFIFLIGWVKIVFSIPSCALLLCLLYLFYKDKTEDHFEDFHVKISWPVIVFISLCLLLLSICCGYGGFVEQASDWRKHNAILQDLYTHAWPVEYIVDGEHTILTYYHALYLFPALLGKIFQSPQFAEISFGVICYVGLWLMSFSLVYVTNANNWYKQIIVILLFLFFSGMLYPLQKVSHLLTELPYCNDWHAYPIGQHLLQYRSVLVMIRWVGPQCYIAWLCIVLFYFYKDDFSSYSILILPALLSGTWSFLGIVVIAILYIFISCFHKNKLIKLFSWKNVFPALIPGIIFVVYLTSNLVVQGRGVENKDTGLVIYQGVEYFWLGLFLFFMYGIIVIITWCRYRNEPLFYTIPLSLCCIPFFSIGSEIDFIMGVSIPAIIFSSFIPVNSFFMTSLLF